MADRVALLQGFLIISFKGSHFSFKGITKLLEVQAAGQVQFQSLTNCENCTKFRYNGIQEKMGLSYGFLLQFLLAGRIGFYNGPDLARGPPIKNPCSIGTSELRPAE